MIEPWKFWTAWLGIVGFGIASWVIFFHLIGVL